MNKIFILIQSCAWWGKIILNCSCPTPRVLGLCRKTRLDSFFRIESIDNFQNKKSYLQLYISQSKREHCEFNTLNSGENYPIRFSDTILKLSERSTNSPNTSIQIQCQLNNQMCPAITKASLKILRVITFLSQVHCMNSRPSQKKFILHLTVAFKGLEIEAQIN